MPALIADAIPNTVPTNAATPTTTNRDTTSARTDPRRMAITIVATATVMIMTAISNHA